MLAGVAGFLLRPARFAVNVPLGHALLGRGVELPEDRVLARLRVPPGLSVTRWADRLPGARLLAFTPTGDLLVSLSRRGEVVLLEPDRSPSDGRSDGRRTLLQGLDRPHGLALHDGFLYVALGGSVVRARFEPGTREAGPLETVVAGLPEGGNHWTRTLHFGPDGGLYVSVGSSCNACVEVDPRRAAILRFRPDGSGGEVFASGLRNAVDFAWHPVSGDLYATDNGRDLLGDDFPPDELNRVVRGGFYGWPFANGDRVPDPDHDDPARVAASLPPVYGFRAHNAALGLAFLPDTPLFPGETVAAVALHGSWNRTRKDGYEVVALHWPADDPGAARVARATDLLWGFEQDEDVVGRPVGVALGPDGALYVSDDYGGSVFRVARGPAPVAAGRPSTGGPPPEVEAPSGPALAARGRELFDRLGCRSCHDPERAAPGVVPRPLSGLAARYRVEDLEALLAAPPPPMPLFPLDAADRKALAVHLREAHR